MDEFLKYLQQINQGASIITGMATPTGALGLLISTIQRIRDRQKAGQITPEQAGEELVKAIDEFDAKLTDLVKANADYYTIPEKPAETPEVFRVTDDGGQPRP
jgi:hypothetical protein